MIKKLFFIIIFLSTITCVNAASYSSLMIVSPANKSTVRNNNATPLMVNVSINPGLQKGDSARLLMDGQLVSSVFSETNETQLSFVVQGIERGEHQLQVMIFGANQQFLISSKLITVYFQQNSAS
jgi:hypothetical protein